MALISSKEIPLTMQLYHNLGFKPSSGRTSAAISQATYAWRRQYLERFGLAVKDLLDWNKDRNQFRSIAATFLMNDKNGETYWPSGDHRKPDIPEYPRDQALLVDLLSQLFWRQMINEHQNRARKRPDIDSSSTDVHSNQQQPNLARPPSSSPHNANSDTTSVPKVPVLHENWDWPHSQVGLTRSASLPAADAARPTEVSQKNPCNFLPPKAPTKGSTASSVTSAKDILDFAKSDGVGHPSFGGTSQESSVSLIRNVPHVPADLNTGNALPGGNSTASPFTPNAADQQHDNTNIEKRIDFDRYSGRLSFWKRQRDIADEDERRSTLIATNTKRSRLMLGPHSPVATGPLPYGVAAGSAGAGKVSALENNDGQTTTTPPQGLDSMNQGTSVSKIAEIHYNIITARKPRLCNVTWTHGGLSNRTWAGLLQEVSQYIDGAYVEGIKFTLQMRDAIHVTSVDRQDENTFVRMRSRWMRIIKEEMAEGISSVFEVDLEPTYKARSVKVEHDEEFDITL